MKTKDVSVVAYKSVQIGKNEFDRVVESIEPGPYDTIKDIAEDYIKNGNSYKIEITLPEDQT
jgi:hypothetical protein